MATAQERRLRVILERLYAADGCRAESAALAADALAYLRGETAALRRDIPVRAVKGGTYRIKEYYLETSYLPDIRGASAIITEVQEVTVPELLRQIVGFDCVIYNGGGNLFALIPGSQPADIGERLEQAAARALLTADVAYICTEPFPLSALLGRDYRKNVFAFENALSDRKKARVLCDYAPVSALGAEKLCGTELRLQPAALPEGTYCTRCCKRIARYRAGGGAVCGGCAHKYLVGRAGQPRFAAEYRQYLTQHGYAFADAVRVPADRSALAGSGRIAAVYADGNNMGGLIQQIGSITEMMDLSAFVKRTMPQLVCRALAQCGITRFEIAAVGGDDVFILLPGDQAIGFSYTLLRLYKDAFGAHFGAGRSTLSAGICIAKPNTPVKVMLGAAEEQLRGAKQLMKNPAFAGHGGSLSFTVMDSAGSNAASFGARSMRPYTYKQLMPVTAFARTLQQKGLTARVRAAAEAFSRAGSEAEMRLFFQYLNAKEQDPEKRLRMPEIEGYTRMDGYYRTADGKCCAFWEDIIDLMQYLKKGNV